MRFCSKKKIAFRTALYMVPSKGGNMASYQFVRVNYSEIRTLFAGGNPVGPTNCPLTINSGTHSFDLGEPRDYEPAEIRRKVANTSIVNPIQLNFTKKTS